MQNISTVHDAHLSLWQSAVADAVDGSEERANRPPDMDHPANAATAILVVSKDPSVDSVDDRPDADPSDDLDMIELSALHYQIAEADVSRDPVDRRLAEKILARSEPVETTHGSIFKSAIGGFKILVGLLNDPVYRHWKRAGGGNIDYSIVRWRLPSSGRIAMIGDWGTGYGDAIAVLRAACAFDPDAIIHLGDIYFAGTEGECRTKFLEPMRTYARRLSDDSPIPVFNLAGNHDYYSGGSGYYWLLDQLNRGDRLQESSYFSLRSEDGGWQFLAMDTGYESRDDVARAHQMGAVPQSDEIEWLNHKLETFEGRTILLSHHQAFSNFDRIGGDPDDREPPFDAVNRRLLTLFEPYADRIAAWFWGHEHHLMIFKDYHGLKGRCVGHSARPISRAEVYEHIGFEFACEDVRLGIAEDGRRLNHGFEIIDLAGKGRPAEVSYYQVLPDGMPDLLYQESLT